ncbi:hypothetical protein [Streptosporangium lutulentum]|uniref:Uncharacterized protein n=1 Tax=Streptosporangium lutulentum TaxID=1461250 RepID=A0ABT9QAI5_9ACTN|nr:hypothetical protein [Streptosporangium lutulentum]MDP9843782.1 hypothetical protein [Streptosporangium lutulentum]
MTYRGPLEMTEEFPFDVLPEHLALLRRARITWEGSEGVGGAPGLDRWTPFGSLDVYGDIAATVDGRTDGAHDPAAESRYDGLLLDLTLVLEIVLRTGRFEPGRYVRSPAGSWQPPPDQG